MLVPVFPPNHKKAGRRKTEKDLTSEEKRDLEYQIQRVESDRLYEIERILGEQELNRLALQQLGANADQISM